MAGGFVFVGKSRLRKFRKEARKLKKLEQKKRNSWGRSGEWSPQNQKIKYEPLVSHRDETDNVSVCSSDSAISSGSEDFLPLIDLRPQSTAFTMPFGPFNKKAKEEEQKRLEEEKKKLEEEERQKEEAERLKKEEEERLRKEEEERQRQEEEERKKKEEEERLAEEKRQEEERKKLEAEEKKNKGFFGVAFFKNKFMKPKEEESLTTPVVEAKEAEVQQKDVADVQDGQTDQKVEKAKVAEEDRECTEMLCCTIM